MTTAIVKHTVADFDQWKAGYDDHEPARQAAGCTSAKVSRGDSGPDGSTEVTIQMEFPDQAAAKRFLDDPELPEVMKAAGVIGIPDVQITESAEATS